MSLFKPYLSAIEAPSLTEVQALPGLTLLEFGTEWCGHCRAAQPLIAQALADRPQWQHLKVEDAGPCAGPPLPRQALAHPGGLAGWSGSGAAGATCSCAGNSDRDGKGLSHAMTVCDSGR